MNTYDAMKHYGLENNWREWAFSTGQFAARLTDHGATAEQVKFYVENKLRHLARCADTTELRDRMVEFMKPTARSGYTAARKFSPLADRLASQFVEGNALVLREYLY